MRKVLLALLCLSAFVFVVPSASAQTVLCSPATAPGCIYTGCLLCGPPPSVCKTVFITEVACALCNDAAEAAYYGSPKPGSGICSSTSAANICTNCDWCVAVTSGCGGGGGFPPICEPPKGHGIPEEIVAGEGGDLETDKARPAPRVWALKHDRWSFLLMEYSGKSMFPFLSKNDKGLYFIQDPNNSMGWLAPSRQGMAQAMGYLLSSLDGSEARVSRSVEVALVPPQPRAAPLVSAGKWAVEWRAVPPIAPFYFPLGEYPRLMYRGKPATLKDLEDAGIRLERMR